MATKLEFDFPMLNKLQKQLEEIGGTALDEAVDKAISESHAFVTKQLEDAIASHKEPGKTEPGKTERSLDKKADIIKTGTSYSSDVGFHITEGGLPSIFLMYGTKVHGQPHITPDKKLYNAIYGTATKKKVQEIQAQAFFETIEKVMKK